MVAVPASMPLIIPALSVALARLLLLQVPPAGVLANVVVSPSHTVATPVIVVGDAFTITIAVLKQLPNVYDITAVPALIPFTTPVAELIVALVGRLLLHTPPPGVAFSVVLLPMHTDSVPVIAAGAVFTDTVVVRWQPVANL